MSVAAGDRADGRRDGVIEDPRLVKIGPEALICKGGQTDNCLSAAQAAAARKVYEGPRDSRGRSLYPGGGFMPGSEPNWTSFVAPAGGRARAWRSGTDTTRYIMSDWGPSWDYADFDWDEDHRGLAEMDVIYSASHPDLRPFKAAGGKLLIYHGWSDTAVAPLNSVDYYETVKRTMGGSSATQSFARLFMIPGMNHCFGGAGAFAIDYISAMENWVERGIPPDRLTGHHLAGRHDGPSMIRRFPVEPSSILFSRQILSYPGRTVSNRGLPSERSSAPVR